VCIRHEKSRQRSRRDLSRTPIIPPERGTEMKTKTAVKAGAVGGLSSVLLS
jgi:hypothetical protein